MSRYDISKVFDLQNSSRTKFYKRFIIKNVEWSDTSSSLEPGQKKRDFDNEPVLDRMEIQLKKSGIEPEFTKNIDLSWATQDISRLLKQYTNDEYILLFPFCSPHLTIKKWPYYNDLIKLISAKFGNEYKIVIAPGPNEINGSKNINALTLLDDGKALDISQLTSIIKESSFVVANDTGPAHIAAHVGAKGLTLFGKHTTAYKVNVERENFKAIQVEDLNNLSAEKVFERVVKSLS